MSAVPFEARHGFVTSAPGKVIVFGEHAVVHGKPAIAAAISLRSYLLVTPKAHSDRVISLWFPDVNLQHQWHVDELPWGAFAHSSKVNRFDDRVTSLDEDLINEMRIFVQASPKLKESTRRIHEAALSSFLYLLLSLASPDACAGTAYSLRSTIPIASGLGSSASISVCIASALLCQVGHLQDPSRNPTEKETEEVLNVINQWAFVGELCIHGNPSGVDNTVATRGKAVLFQRSLSGGKPSVTPLDDFPVLPLLLVNTNQERSTATEVAKVGALKESHPTVTDLILDAIGKITESAHELMSAHNFESTDAGSLQSLGELVRINHGLLVALGVSHPKLERIRELTDYTGVGWTKLTGAGGGGCAFTVLKPDADQEVLSRLEANLASEGFDKYETLLGASGVGILKPAEGKGTAINQKAFLSAKGNGEVAQLMEGAQQAWKYWD